MRSIRFAAVAVALAVVIASFGSSVAFGAGGTDTALASAAAAAKGGLSASELSDFRAFGDKNPGRWQVLADPSTGRIQDVFGASTAAYKGSPGQVAARFLADNEGLVNARVADLRQAGVTTGKAASHVVYRQYFNGVPVEGALVQVHVDQRGRTFWVQTHADPTVSVSSTRASISAADAEQFAARAAFLSQLPAVHPATVLVILPGESGDRLSYKVRFHTDSPRGDWIYYVDALDGSILATRDELMDAAGTVTGKVYARDPGTAVALSPMANQYVTVGGVRATTGATGAYTASAAGAVAAAMTGPYARVVNEDQAGASRSAAAASWTWDFPTSDSRFDELNVFFHMNRIHDYFKQTLGITQMDVEMTATVHFGDSYANAYYSPQDKALSFGDGDGVNVRDSAKAAEVIYHEYGHATQDSVYAPMGEAGIYSMEIRSMGEAWSDYYSQVLTNDDEFGEWWIVDPAQRRPLVNTKQYPRDMQGEEHADGPIFAGALWDYRTAVGTSIADRTVAASWAYRPSDFRNGLVAMLQADDELYGDMDLGNGTPHEAQIRAAFSAHGITTTLPEALGSLVFARNTSVGGLTMPVLYQSAADGTGARMIPTTVGWEWPDWNEAARVIVASGNDAVGHKVIYAIDPLTGARVQLTGNLGSTGRVLALYPSLSPTAEQVCFSWAYQGQAMMNLSIADVGEMDPMKPMGTQVPNVDDMDAGANEYYPDWSKANGTIVYAQMYGPLLDKAKAGLWVVQPNGTGLSQVTHPSYFFGTDGTLWAEGDYYPKWSRTGDKIAYVRLYSGIPVFGDMVYDYHVYVMNADGSGAPGTLVMDGHASLPATTRVMAGMGIGDLSWSPAADALMFCAAGGATSLGSPTSYDLYRVGTNGAGLTRVTTDGGTATSSWGALDTSPPQVTGVQIQAPIDRTDRLTFTVDAADAQSGIHNYQYAIGTTAGGTDARLWTTVSGAANRFTATRLALLAGRTYYVSVKARNGHGYVSSAAFSAGVTASQPPPVADEVAPVTSSDAAGSYVGTATIHLTATDNAGGSGVAHTYYKLDGGAQTEGTDVSSSAAGAHTLEFWSVDNASNTEAHHTANFTIVPEGSVLPTSITIRTAATATSLGKTVALSGAVTPLGLIGQNIVAYVLKPGSARWTYSSNRTVYASGGGAAWLYKYYFKPGMTKGTYKFKAVVPAWPGFLTSTSPTTVSISVR